jgi:hypothetical protein
MKNKKPVSVENWLAKLPAEVREITAALIGVARKKMPDAHEFIYHDAVGYSVSESAFDRICYIAPQKKGYVNFGFFFGAGLPDPKKLLIGEGKRLRHVKVWSVGEAMNPALAKLVTLTWKQAAKSFDKIHLPPKQSKPNKSS